jgi:deferrochelatase/peroxidase EfeB
MNPRDSDPPSRFFAQTKRILRRGVAFGASLNDEADPTSVEGANAAFPNDRGLIFVCYQSSIHDKFEFLQQTLVDNPNFPSESDGSDPLRRWVITTGGDYFLSPSIDALAMLGGEFSSRMNQAG